MIRKVLLTVTASLCLLAAGGLPAAQAATARTAAVASTTAQDDDGDYLALGDSVSFGYNPLLPVGSDPRRYIGYPELASRRLELRLTNLSCPGQTTAGFLALTGDDNGCFTFRRFAALHTGYQGSQLDAALAFLGTHPKTRLVTITLGANDLSLCRDATADGCTSPAEVGATLRSVAANLTTALTAIRRVYHGPLVAMTYYSVDYTDPATVAAAIALDGTLATVTTALGGSVADGFTPFLKTSAANGGSPCAAGLLIALPTGGCDIHPTIAGTRLLARALVSRKLG